MKGIEEIIISYKGILLAKRHLEKIDTNLNQEFSKLLNLQTRLEKEFKDIDRLANLSVYNLFHTVLGNKDEQYEIEKQEYLSVLLQYIESKNVMKLLEFEKEILEEKIKQEDEVVKTLEKLAISRSKELDEKYPDIALDLRLLDQKWDDFSVYQIELKEALTVAHKAKVHFEKMIALLKLARRSEEWGFSVMKVEVNIKSNPSDSNLNEAQKMSFKANVLLKKLGSELDDIYKMKKIGSTNNFPEFKLFTNIYYDRLISDWVMQKKIVSAITHLFGTLETIKSIIKSLEIEKESLDKQMIYVYDRMNNLIVDYVKGDVGDS